jgi:hypothetical protein
VTVRLADDRSEFKSRPTVRVRRDDGDYIIEIVGAVAIANSIAWASEQLDPNAIYLGLSLANPTTQALKFLLWGEGEVGVMVYEVLARYWNSTPEDDIRPYIFLISE